MIEKVKIKNEKLIVNNQVYCFVKAIMIVKMGITMSDAMKAITAVLNESMLLESKNFSLFVRISNIDIEIDIELLEVASPNMDGICICRSEIISMIGVKIPAT